LSTAILFSAELYVNNLPRLHSAYRPIRPAPLSRDGWDDTSTVDQDKWQRTSL